MRLSGCIIWGDSPCCGKPPSYLVFVNPLYLAQ
jgi:hypothetical protein